MRDRLRCCQRDAIPHHVTIIQRNQQRALADRKARLERDAGEAEIVTPDEPVTFGERPGVRKVWPFQFTNCRSSSQIGQDAGGFALTGNWAPQVSQVQRGMVEAPLRDAAPYASSPS